MALLVYVLCFVTALGCSVVLFTAYRRSGAPLLLWSSLCFAALAANETIVLLDIYVIHGISLLLARRVAGLVAVLLMLVGLIIHSRGTSE